MARTLKVLRHVHDEMIRHCQLNYPKEACGILARLKAPRPGEERVAVQGYPMRNVEDSPIGYSMDPKEQFQIEKHMRQAGQEMLAIYHSHTASDAYPSSVDVSLAISPDISYVLVSLKDRDSPIIKSYQIDGTSIEPEHLILEIGAPPGTKPVGRP